LIAAVAAARGGGGGGGGAAAAAAAAAAADAATGAAAAGGGGGGGGGGAGARPATMRSVLRALAAERALPGALFRGVLPAYLRQGPHALIMLPVMEKLRALLGLDAI